VLALLPNHNILRCGELCGEMWRSVDNGVEKFPLHNAVIGRKTQVSGLQTMGRKKRAAPEAVIPGPRDGNEGRDQSVRRDPPPTSQEAEKT